MLSISVLSLLFLNSILNNNSILVAAADLTAAAVANNFNSNEIGLQNENRSSNDRLNSFFMAVSMIGLSEIGDKTFLIAVLMAMRHSRLFVFSSAASSLAIMTILSGIVGHAVISFISERYTAFLAALLFLIFGYKLTMEGLEMSKDAGVEEEMAEVEEELAANDMNSRLDDMESGSVLNAKKQQPSVLNKIYDLAALIFSPAWVQIFVLNFFAELGDRSQISIIALASDNNYRFTIAGAVVGHLICCGFAVIGGKYLASKISMRTVTLAGAFCFFLFAVIYLYSAFTF
ncbi:putative ribosome biosynthesis protein GDT1 PWA37_002272 [Arxiozyma heterogenica]|uniref:putative ribosome biosynthesis protein GDT1 n=1 Tax=Arxiozyma heterogenica TaxID=278026 RepID=UPI002EE59AC4